MARWPLTTHNRVQPIESRKSVRTQWCVRHIQGRHMKTHVATLILAVLGSTTALLAPNTSQAGNVGYYGQCYGGTPAAQITAAGHTPVALASAPNASNLAGLSMLFAENCGTLTDPGVAAAVANGMTLVVHDSSYGSGPYLPGSPSLAPASSPTSNDIDFPPGTPYLNGPAGALDNTSLDDGSSSNHGAVALASLPGGASVSATTANTSHVVTFSYPYGAGRVIFSTIPLQCYLPGGNCFENSEDLLTVSLNMQKYATTLIACALDANCAPAAVTTCASEGYTGTKLTWCRNICEKGYTGATLDTWIHRWISKYRDLPYCAQEGGEEEQPPQDA